MSTEHQQHAKAVMVKVREIVKKERSSAESWITLDERGKWQQRAEELSEKTATKRVQLGMSHEQWTEELARRLIFEATEALLLDAKRRAKRRAKG